MLAAMLKLSPPPPLSGTALKALVAAAEAPASGALVFAIMSKQMGITELLSTPCEGEPHPIDERPRPFAGRSAR